MSEYFEALETCDCAIFDLWGAINDLLPDYKGEYLEEWSLGDCEYINNQLHSTADTILSTVMRDHCAYEVHRAIDAWDNAYKNKNIPACKAAFEKCCGEFRRIRIVCQRAKKLVG